MSEYPLTEKWKQRALDAEQRNSQLEAENSRIAELALDQADKAIKRIAELEADEEIRKLTAYLKFMDEHPEHRKFMDEHPEQVARILACITQVDKEM